jgi:pimeloyl-ACP methyl ester carboxylesterase
VFYQLYYQAPGVAEAELERNVRSTIRQLNAGSADEPADARPRPPRPEGEVGMVPRRGGLIDPRRDPLTLPPWLTEADIDFLVGEYSRTGFRGGLNWYRNIDRNWELLAPFAGARIAVPALYIIGERDGVLGFPGMDELIPNLATYVPRLRRTLLLPGCGHLTQQERPDEVNAALLEFLAGLPAPA